MKIPIVNEQDEIIKIIDANERQKGDIGRVSALWITNENGGILLAQRAFRKLRDPGRWGAGVAGTLEEGETYEQNVIKEAEEEIGLKNFTLKFERKVRRSSSHEYFAQWFSAVVKKEYPFIKQDHEVEQIKWFSKGEILKMFKENPELFVPNFGLTIEYFIT
jgi:isopentenyldiphosphate isomerase